MLSHTSWSDGKFVSNAYGTFCASHNSCTEPNTASTTENISTASGLDANWLCKSVTILSAVNWLSATSTFAPATAAAFSSACSFNWAAFNAVSSRSFAARSVVSYFNWAARSAVSFRSSAAFPAASTRKVSSFTAVSSFASSSFCSVSAFNNASWTWTSSSSAFIFVMASSTLARSRAVRTDSAVSIMKTTVITDKQGIPIIVGTWSTHRSIGLWITSVRKIVKKPHATEEVRQIYPFKLKRWLL